MASVLIMIVKDDFRSKNKVDVTGVFILGEPERCREDQFECGSGECIDQGSKCDGRPDCRDQSDERVCPKLRNAM